jgi:cell division protein FtsI (penicillin-binding protein 3)
LTEAVQRAHAKSGSAIVMDPHTGEILALANAPTFNPNQPAADSPETRTNGALQNTYEPGSTFKIVAYSPRSRKAWSRPTTRSIAKTAQSPSTAVWFTTVIPMAC